MSEPSEWLIYRGIGEPHDGVPQLPPRRPGVTSREVAVPRRTGMIPPTAVSVSPDASPRSTGRAPRNSK